MIGLSVSYFFLPLSFPWLTKHRDAIKRLRAWTMGAHFITDKGVVLQSGSNDCGPASLKMILAAHGIECSISDLSSHLRLTREGTSMLDLRSVSVKMGLRARSWSVQPGDLNRIPLPAIAFVNRNHFVVLRRFVAPGVLEVDDPALGRIRWPAREFNRVWSGEMLIFDPAWTPP